MTFLFQCQECPAGSLGLSRTLRNALAPVTFRICGCTELIAGSVVVALELSMS